MNGHNTTNRSANQTCDDARHYFIADARLKLSREAQEEVAEQVETGRTQEQVAADH